MDLNNAERIWMNKAEALAYVQAVFPTLGPPGQRHSPTRGYGPQLSTRLTFAR